MNRSKEEHYNIVSLTGIGSYKAQQFRRKMAQTIHLPALIGRSIASGNSVRSATLPGRNVPEEWRPGA
jgi:hypothetical protein